MSNASTVAHYILHACKAAGSPLDGECSGELADALQGLVDEAVARAVRELSPEAK